jgi:hypothetical protein
MSEEERGRPAGRVTPPILRSPPVQHLSGIFPIWPLRPLPAREPNNVRTGATLHDSTRLPQPNTSLISLACLHGAENKNGAVPAAENKMEPRRCATSMVPSLTASRAFSLARKSRCGFSWSGCANGRTRNLHARLDSLPSALN